MFGMLRCMKDITGLTFGVVTVLGPAEPDGRRARWRCRCLCGAEFLSVEGNLRQSSATKCWCSIREKTRARRITHDLTSSPEHRAWCNLRNRCKNPRNVSFPEYGGRGIFVDPRWDEFATFLLDMGLRPSRRHSIERRDNSGPYSATNCIWAIGEIQANNKRNNTLLTFQGRTQTLARWAREVGLEPDTLCARISKMGWTTEKALTTPPRGWAPNRPRKIMPDLPRTARSIAGSA